MDSITTLNVKHVYLGASSFLAHGQLHVHSSEERSLLSISGVKAYSVVFLLGVSHEEDAFIWKTICVKPHINYGCLKQPILPCTTVDIENLTIPVCFPPKKDNARQCNPRVDDHSENRGVVKGSCPFWTAD